MLDDQAVIINVRDKGLIVLTGCGHAGIVNICRYARRLTGDRPLYAAMGGFHLNGPAFEPRRTHRSGCLRRRPGARPGAVSW